MTVSSRYWRWLCSGLIFLGLVVSGYLLARGFALMGHDNPGDIDACESIFGVDCDATLSSPQSEFLGTPLAGWGVVYFVSLGTLLFMGWAIGKTFVTEALLTAWLLSLVGAFVSLFLALSMLTAQTPLCPACFGVHIVSWLLVPALQKLNGRSSGALLTAFAENLRFYLRSDTVLPAETRWRIVGLVAAFLVAVVTYQWIYIETALRKVVAEEAQYRQMADAFRNEQPQIISLSADDPRKGSSDPTVTLVVFSSFQCPGCRKLAEELDRLLARNGDELQIVYKHFPLSSACNSEIKVDQHPQGCAVACAAIAAQRQGKFWEFHNEVVATPRGLDDQSLQQLARQAGLDGDQFERDRKDLAVTAKLAADIQLGNRLKLVSTPTVFINNRLVRKLNSRLLEILIESELQTELLK